MCSHCAEGKAKAAAIPKTVEDEKRSKKPGERLAFDVSSIKARSYGGAKYWLLVMDDATGFIWSYFLKFKSQVKDKIVAMIKHLDQKYGYNVKYLRCDNVGENIKTEEECHNQGLGVTFEYTSPNTPQQNGRVERKFTTLYGRVRSMMNAERLIGSLRTGLWAECARTATNLDLWIFLPYLMSDSFGWLLSRVLSGVEAFLKLKLISSMAERRGTGYFLSE